MYCNILIKGHTRHFNQQINKKDFITKLQIARAFPPGYKHSDLHISTSDVSIQFVVVVFIIVVEMAMVHLA